MKKTFIGNRTGTRPFLSCPRRPCLSRMLSRAILRDFFAGNFLACTLGTILRAVKKPFWASLRTIHIIFEVPQTTIDDHFRSRYIWLSWRERNPSRYIEEVHVETKCNLLLDVSGKLTLQIRFEILRLTVCQHCLNVLTWYWPSVLSLKNLNSWFGQRFCSQKYDSILQFWPFRTLWNIRKDVCQHWIHLQNGNDLQYSIASLEIDPNSSGLTAIHVCVINKSKRTLCFKGIYWMIIRSSHRHHSSVDTVIYCSIKLLLSHIRGSTSSCSLSDP